MNREMLKLNEGQRRDLVEGNTHGKNKWAILFTVLIMTFMATLDSSIVNVAMPVMQRALDVGLDDIQWVSSVYLLATCAILLVFGRLGDMFGKVRLFQLGVAVFTVGSLLCGMSATLPQLVGARVVQGIGGAGAMANNMGIITEAFPARERGRALGLLSSFVALGMMCGPVLGGFIVSALPWEYIFLINVPVGVASLMLGMKTLPRTSIRAAGRSLDPLGSALLVPGISITFVCITMLESGVEASLLVGLAAGLALLVGFGFHERRASDPLVPLELFADRMFAVNLLCLFITFVAIGAYELMTPFYLQDARGFSPSLSGLIFCVIPLVNAITGPLSGAASDRIGCELPTCAGLAVFSFGLFMVGRFDMDSELPQILLFLGLASLGTSLFQSPNNSLIMGSVPNELLGFAGSVSALARYLGLATGITGSMSLLYGQMSVVAGERVTAFVEGRPDIFLHGYQAVYLVLTVLVAFGFGLTLWRMHTSRR